MKKKLVFALLCCILFIPKPVSAFSASASCSGPSSVTVGQSFTVTISGRASSTTDWKAATPINSSGNLRLTSDTGSGIWEDDKASISKSYTFNAISEGTATINQSFTVTNTDDYSSPTITSSSCTINIVKPVQPTPTTQNKTTTTTTTQKNNNTKTNEENQKLSSDNSLKSLSIEGVNIKPDFDKDTLEYGVNLSSDTKSIKIVAQANDQNANVSGTGEIQVNEGNNTIQIVVTAETGATRTYKINAYVKEKSEIVVTVDSEKYTVLKKIIDINEPTGFKKSTIKIKDMEVESFYNDKINYTLVALKDEIGNINLYIYDKKIDDYIKYSPIISDDINIIVLKANEKDIPHRYITSKFKYNNKEIIGYALNEASDFRLIYGINALTGEKSFFLYDMKDHTIQRFYNDQVNAYINLVNKCKLAFMILGGFILLLTIIIIILLSKNVKFKNKYLSKRLNPIDNPGIGVKYQDLEGTKSIDTSELNGKNKKKKEKTFLDE